MSATVLIVDDNDVDRQMILALLRARSPELRLVGLRDGVEALDYFYGGGDASLRQAGQPTLVLLDLNMPRASGLDVLRRVKGDPGHRHVPIVVFTSSPAEADGSRCYQLGANAYVVKPAGFDHFSSAVHRIADFWLDTARAGLSSAGAKGHP